jgi:hypothetical protein
MSRFSLFFAFLTLALASCAQVMVQSNGTAAAAGTGIQGAPVSPPTLFAPIIRLDQGQTEPIDASALNPRVLAIDSLQQQQQESQGQSGNGAAVATSRVRPQPFNFGVARYDLNQFAGPSADNGQSLGDLARQLKQRQQNVNAKSFTNADIQRIDQQTTGGVAGATAAGNNNWPDNNGVITPGGSNAPGSVGAPVQNQNQGQSPKSPFAPRSQNAEPANPSGAASDRPYETAPNNSANAGIPQPQAQSSAAANSNSGSDNSSLPGTATRLPLIGVLGFFSVSMGLFVRYQRAKASR